MKTIASPRASLAAGKCLVAVWACLSAAGAAVPALAAPEDVAAGPAPVSDPATADPGALPAESRGDLRFVADLARFGAGGADGADLELYLQIPHRSLKFIDVAGQWQAHVLLELEVTGENGQPVASRRQDLTLYAESLEKVDDWGSLQLLQQQLRLPPGVYRMNLKLTDQEALRLGLLYRILGRHREGRVEVDFAVPDFGAAPMALSDLQFARKVVPRMEEPLFEKGDQAVVPNPGRLYGLLLPKLSYYVEVYDSSWAAGDTVMLSASVLNADGERLASLVRRVEARSLRWAWVDALDLAGTRVGSGRHHLTLIARNERTGRSAARQADFDVIWSAVSWGKDPDTIVDEIRFVVDESDLDRLEEMSPGAREEWLRSFWAGNDPTPNTVENEFMDEHYRRVAYANLHFGSYAEGMLTDRGRIWIRYGRPDEVERGFASADFVQGLGLAGDLADRDGARSGETLFLGNDAVVDGQGSKVLQDKSYEIWIYEGQGRPLTNRKRQMDAQSLGLTFVFLDDRGYGDLRLVHSSDAGEM
jgi:GWxTD domain-containing protein